MSTFKNYPELNVVEGAIEGLFRLETNAGRVVIAGSMDKNEAQRLAACWNALRSIAFPDAHLKATEDYVKRLEQLRKDAVSMLHEQASEVAA